MNLAGDDHRVKNPPEIVARGEIGDCNLPGFGVDLDFGDVGAGWEGEVLRVVEGGLVETGFQLLMREVVRHISRQRDFPQSLRAIGSRNGELAVLELDI